MRSSQSFITLILILGSLALLIPGITAPMLTLTGNLEKARIANTATGIIVDMMVDRSMAQNSDQSEEEVRERSQGNINGMLTMFGLNNLSGEIEAYRKTRSILGTVRELYTSGNILVSFLVMLFSVVIPVTKIFLLLTGTFTTNNTIKSRAFSVSGLISKWSMADVFVVAIIVAFMAANASEGMGDLMQLHATFEYGFFFFLGYCLFSIASSQWAARQQAT